MHHFPPLCNLAHPCQNPASDNLRWFALHTAYLWTEYRGMREENLDCHLIYPCIHFREIRCAFPNKINLAVKTEVGEGRCSALIYYSPGNFCPWGCDGTWQYLTLTLWFTTADCLTNIPWLTAWIKTYIHWNERKSPKAFQVQSDFTVSKLG